MFEPSPRPWVIGHRGAAGAAPENTLPALRHALEVGADAVEFDVRTTRDEVPVLLHDPTVERTTDGRGPVAAFEYAELARLDAGWAFSPDRGASHPFRGQGVRVPTLREALEAIGSLPAILEVKDAGAAEAVKRWIREELGPARAPERLANVAVGGFSRRQVAELAEFFGRRCATREELTPYVLLGKVGLAGLAVPRDRVLAVPPRRRLVRILTGRFVRRAHRDGLPVYAWTIDRPDVMRRLLALGIDGLISDFPARARRITEERAAA